MVFQNNPELKDEINKSGCNLLCHLFIAQIENKTVLTCKDINKLYDKFLKKGWVDDECTVFKPNEIINSVSKKKIYQVGSIINGKTTYWYKNKRYDWIICKYITNGIYGTHFVVTDKKGNSIYDPLLGEGYTISRKEAFRLYQVI